MADNPSKTLTVKRNESKSTLSNENEGKNPVGVLTPKKRIVKLKQTTKHSLQVTSRIKPKNKKPPSTLRVNALDLELGKNSKAWRSHSPLAIGIEKQLFQEIASRQLSASKRVVRLLLQKHCLNKNYLVDVLEGAKRLNLDGSPSGVCSIEDEEYARSMLAHLEIQSAVKKNLRKKR